ncbi:uncharacterized protein LOC126675079 [Mercurialis annua]|uniref:uncharacterized protein LOC126670388 n=1 Tax=Mercurialis annua TaxID=3986 RepID=UPI00215F8A83|nr:uncharacterized protein LOC126670388 [Mercurialis annua]XP_050225612.1 uncharacterized protein LOC126675079 [Mercurialis annua]
MSSISEPFMAFENVTLELYNLPPTHERGNCRHGRLYLYTSWTKNNPGRRFWRCRKSRTTEDCGAFRWYDGEVPFEQIIKFGVLLDKVRGLTDQLASSKKVIEELNETVKELEDNKEKAIVAFTNLLDESDRLLKENAELKSQACGSQSFSRS